jgi:hypothetical protein
MIITHHSSNPKFAQELHNILESHKQYPPGELTHILTAYRRTRNLKETLTKARFTEEKPTKHTLSNRSVSTYDKNQLIAPIRHIIRQCQCGNSTIIDKYNNLKNT